MCISRSLPLVTLNRTAQRNQVIAQGKAIRMAQVGRINQVLHLGTNKRAQPGRGCSILKSGYNEKSPCQSVSFTTDAASKDWRLLKQRVSITHPRLPMVGFVFLMVIFLIFTIFL